MYTGTGACFVVTRAVILGPVAKGVCRGHSVLSSIRTKVLSQLYDSLDTPVPTAVALCSDSEWSPAAPPALLRAPSRGRQFPRVPPPTRAQGDIELKVSPLTLMNILPVCLRLRIPPHDTPT